MQALEASIRTAGESSTLDDFETATISRGDDLARRHGGGHRPRRWERGDERGIIEEMNEEMNEETNEEMAAPSVPRASTAACKPRGVPPARPRARRTASAPRASTTASARPV